MAVSKELNRLLGVYKCQLCQKVVPPGTKAFRIPVEFRLRHYPPKARANRVVSDNKVHYVDDPGGTGYEIAREVTACPDCAANYKKI
jgi:hypothetical protein